MKIFLSYPSEIGEIAKSIAISLRARNNEVFLDENDLPPGNTYEQQIETAVEQSDLLVFLITPGAVERGRFTLTELRFAERAWPNPHERILPVMIEDTDLSKVPAYLKGVTIFEPAGNVPAEVASEVDNLRGKDFLLRRVFVFGFSGLLSGILSWLSLKYLPSILKPNFDIGFITIETGTMIVPAILMSVALFFAIGRYDGKKILSLLTLIFFITIGSVTAWNYGTAQHAAFKNVLYSQEVIDSIRESESSDILTREDRELDPYSASGLKDKLKKRRERLSVAIAGFIAGGIGAGISMIAIMILYFSARSLAGVGIPILLGCIFGILIAFEIGQFLLFPLWQAGVCAAMGYSLSRKSN